MDFTAVLFPGQGSCNADAGDHARDVVPEPVARACELVGGYHALGAPLA